MQTAHGQVTPIMLIGAMKCGTTTLHSHLSQHPEICGGTVKEPEYFSQQSGQAQYKEGRYEDLFPVASQHRFVLDASPGYTKYPNESGVPERIKAYGLAPYFVYIIRNPFERIRSHYNYMQRDPNWRTSIDSPYLVEVSKYAMQLAQFEGHFPADRILLVEFDQLKADPARLCRRIFEFVGASSFEIDLPSDPVINKTYSTKHMRIQQYVGRFGKYFPMSIRLWFRRTMESLFPAKQLQLSTTENAKIKAALAEDMAQLHAKYGIDISKWGFSI